MSFGSATPDIKSPLLKNPSEKSSDKLFNFIECLSASSFIKSFSDLLNT